MLRSEQFNTDPHLTEGKVLALAYAYRQATDCHMGRSPLTANTVMPPIIESKPAAKPGDTKNSEKDEGDCRLTMPARVVRFGAPKNIANLGALRPPMAATRVIP